MLIIDMLNHQGNYFSVVSLWFGTEISEKGKNMLFFSVLTLQSGVIQALEMPLLGD